MNENLSRIPESSAPPIILVVDNDANGGKYVCTVLNSSGYQTLLASCGMEALKWAQSGKIDLVISDLVMPSMNGPELIRQMQEILPGVKYAFTSGFTEAAAVRFGYMPKAPFLEKPISSAALRKLVAELLGLEVPPRRLSA